MLPCHHPVNAPPSQTEGTLFNGSFRQFVSPSTLPGGFHSAQTRSSQADCKSARGQKAGRMRSRLCSWTSRLPSSWCTDTSTVSGKCVWPRNSAGFCWAEAATEKMWESQSGKNEKGPGKEGKSLPWCDGVREPIKSYREQGHQQWQIERTFFFLLPNSYHDMKWTWTRNLAMRCSSSLFVFWLNWSS